MVYAFKTGSFIKADAQAAGEMCEKLAAEGRLTAKDLVDENRPEEAPLHNEFEWNNDLAADKWREQQARHIIGSLIVKVEQREPVRAFYNITRNEPNYNHIETILESTDNTEKLLKTALNELIAFKKKYEMLEQLSKVFDAIEEVQKGA